jgi:hypothetical protein
MRTRASRRSGITPEPRLLAVLLLYDIPLPAATENPAYAHISHFENGGRAQDVIDQEVELTFINSRREFDDLARSKKAAERTVTITTEQWKAGAIDLTPEFVAEQFLAQVDIQYAQAQGDIALGLISVYRAIGGGWELRLTEPGTPTAAAPVGDAAPRAVLGAPKQN